MKLKLQERVTVMMSGTAQPIWATTSARRLIDGWFDCGTADSKVPFVGISEDHEGVTWIRGWHFYESEECQALRAANALSAELFDAPRVGDLVCASSPGCVQRCVDNETPGFLGRVVEIDDARNVVMVEVTGVRGSDNHVLVKLRKP